MANDNDVIPFKPRVASAQATPSDHQAALVDMFEEYLQAAKAGKIRFAAIATVDIDHVALNTWEPAGVSSQVLSAALGSVGFLNHRFNAACDQGCEPTDKIRG